MSSVVHYMQRSGRLLDEKLLRDQYPDLEDFGAYAYELEGPCAALRRVILNIPLDWLTARNSMPDFVPFPLVNLAGSGLQPTSDWHEYKLRHSACIINEAYVNLQTQCTDAMQWQFSQEGRNAQNAELHLSLPEIRTAWAEMRPAPEAAPKLVSTMDDVYQERPWLRATLKFRSHAAQNAWIKTMTPHTFVMLFLSDKQRSEHLTMMAYTVPADEDEREGADGEALGDLLADKTLAIPVKLASIYYVAPNESVQQLAAVRGGYQEIESLLRDFNKYPQDFEFSAARLDGVLMHEHALQALATMPHQKKHALLYPEYHRWNLNWDKYRTCAQADHIYDLFDGLVSPYLAFPLAPQQLRFCLLLIVHLYEVALVEDESSQFSMGALGGPPGTGKTATVVQAIILSRIEDVVRPTIEMLRELRTLSKREVSIDDAVKAVLTFPIVYTAPTNQATDTGCLALAKAAARAELRQPGSTNSLQIIRICDIEKVEYDVKILRLHSRLPGAAMLLKVLQKEHAETSASFAHQVEMKNSREAEKDSAPDEPLQDSNLAETPSPVQTSAGLTFQRKKVTHADIDAKYPYIGDKALKEMHSKRDRLQGEIDTIQRFIADPLLNPLSADKKRLRALSTRADSYVDALQGDPRNICCFTAGYVNPYHDRESKTSKDIKKTACSGTITVLDEAGQCDQSHLLVLVKEARSLLLCGDVHQLGSVLKGPPHANYDLRQSLMEKLTDSTLWLTLCWRLSVVMTRFLHEFVYPRYGLYHPTGQNLIRASPLHAYELFQPVVILDVQGKSFRPSGSTSLRNDEEVIAAQTYLQLFAEAAQTYGLPPTDVALVSPYAAQAKRLESVRDEMQGDSAYSSMTAGPMESIQGATTGICITSLVSASATSGNVNINFLTAERFTVAISRATGHCVLICDVVALRRGLEQSTNTVLEAFLDGRFPVISISEVGFEMAQDLQYSAHLHVPAALTGLDDILPCDAPTRPNESKFRQVGEPFDTQQLRRTLEEVADKLSSISICAYHAERPKTC